MTNTGKETLITAAALAIGDELLSGRTRDKNIGHLANALTQQGIDLREVRIVPDVTSEIVEALNALRSKYTHVFTSGGIGPTHDDITADAVGIAFNVPVKHDPDAMQILQEHYGERSMEFTPARKRMARIPEGASLIDNPVSKAPGFQIENVFVMAGVPAVFNAMLENVLANLEGGTLMQSETIVCSLGEGTIGDGLGDIQKAHPETSIGSYPKFDGKTFSTHIVIRSRTPEMIADAADSVRELIVRLQNNSV
ncbi:MAG: competence/damage-inducible protein A [Pseudomonadota bacterium]